MPTVIATSTQATATAYSNQRKVDRTSNGVLWMLYNSGAQTNTLVMRYSTDNGATWTAGGTVAGWSSGTYTPNSSLFIDIDDYAHVVYKDMSNGYIYYKRGTPNAARTAWTWSAANTYTTQVEEEYPDIVAHREGTGWKVHITSSYRYASSVANLGYYRRFNVSSDGVISGLEGSIQLHPNYGVQIHTYISIDFNHTGDGKTVAGGTPHLYAAWSAGANGAGKGIRFRKAVYSAGSWTWNAEREIDTGHHINHEWRWLNCLFDGTRVIIAGFLYDGTNFDLVLHERDAADTTTTTRVLLDNVSTAAGSSAPAWMGSATYDGNGNVYLFGRTNEDYLRYRKWTRSTATLGAAVLLDSTTIATPWVSAKRGYLGSRIEWVYNDGTASPYNVSYDGISLNAAPNAPTLVAPTNGATIDLSVATLFDWTFSDPDASDTQSAWAFRRKLSGAASYEYWNASTTAWQSTEVWNSGSTSEYTFAAGSWANGNTYNWSVATKDSAGAIGPYAGDWTVTGGQPPSVTVDAPTGTVVINRPNAQWTFSDPAGGTQVTYHLKVYDSVQYSATGFDPNTTAALHDTGEVTSSSDRQRTIQADLQTSTTYRAYMRVKDNEGIYSQWAYSQFSVILSPPNVPTITVTDDPDNARVIIDVQGHDNLLTENQASIETDTSGWGAINSTLTRSTAQAADGAASLLVTATAADVFGPYTNASHAVVAGQQYTALASIRHSAGTARSTRVGIEWRDAADALISGSYGAYVTPTTTAWSALSVTGAAPAGAVGARIVVYTGGGAINDAFHIDKVSIQPGSVTTWARGGLAAATAFIVERSMDGGITWEPVRGTELGQVHDGAPTQKLRVLDREIGPGTQPTYRAKTTVEV